MIHIYLKFKAFTIIELIVVLLLSAIITGILYYSVVIFNKQFLSYQEKSGVANEFILFQNTIHRDVLNSQIIISSKEKTINLLSDSIKSEIRYEFDSCIILREEAFITDTFHICTELLKIGYVSDSSRLIDNVVINCTLGKEHILLTTIKRYDAIQLINNSISNE